MWRLLLVVFALHRYLSLFTQTFFLHRYSAHGMFVMSRGWEKIRFVLTRLFQGSSYMSPYAYGALHRMHHAFADTDRDPHSPLFSANIIGMMGKTLREYRAILHDKVTLDPLFTKRLPQRRSFDRFAHSRSSRIGRWILYMVGLSLLIYFGGLPSRVYALLVVLVPLHILMWPIHGAIVNRFAHKIWYRNFKQSNTSTNLLPIDVLMLGEWLHNNHHGNPMRANFATKKWEFDPVYPVIVCMKRLGIIRFAETR